MKKSKLILSLAAVAASSSIVAPAILLSTSCFGTSSSKFSLIKTSEGYCIDGLKAVDRSSVTSIVVPEYINDVKVVEISKGAFKGCSNLESITLPFIGHTANATAKAGLFGYIFGDEKYEGCGGLTWQEYSTNDHYEATDVEYAEWAIPSTLKSITITNATNIPAGAFSNCNFIRDITIKTATTNDEFEIGNYAFYCCRYLRNFTFPTNTTVIGRRTFQGCYNLKEIDVPSGVTTIKHNAFSNCISCTTAKIPDTVTNMGKLVFENFISGVVMTEDEDPTTTKANWDSEWVEQDTSVVYGYYSGGLYYTTDAIIALCGKENKYGFILSWTGTWDVETLTIPSTFEVDGVTYNIEKIGPNVFYGNDVTKTFIIPDTIKAISANAFQNCTALEYVDFGDKLQTIGAEAFIGCEKLHGHLDTNGNEAEGIDFKNVKTIGNSAFKGDIAITNVTFSYIETIGESAFEDCHALSPVKTRDEQTSSHPVTDHPLSFPASLKSIGAYAFRNDCWYKPTSTSVEYSYLNEADVVFDHESTNEIKLGESCFENFGVKNPDTSLYQAQIKVHVDFNNVNIKEIPNNAFKKSYTYGIYNFPDSVESIGDYAFYGNDINFTNKQTSFATAKQFIIPAATKYIGSNAFYHNEFVTFGLNANNQVLETIGSYAFQYCSSSGVGSAYETIKEFALPNSVKSIGAGAFYGCTVLEKVTLPTNPEFTRLESSVFGSCTKLGINQVSFDDVDNGALIVPSSVTYIGSSAFSNCTSLKFIDIQGNIKTLGSSVFVNCKELDHDPSNGKIAIKFADNLANVTSIGTYLYQGCSKMVWAPFPPSGNNSITTIPAYIFDMCVLLTDFQILDSITNIGEAAFKDCNAMTKVTGCNAVKIINKNAFIRCSGLTQFDMPSGCYTIGDKAFSYCTNLGKDDNHKFVLPTDITQAISSGSTKGMGLNPFEGWTGDQKIYFTTYNIDRYDGDNIITRWGWELEYHYDSVTSTTYYTCEASGSSTVHFVLKTA